MPKNILLKGIHLMYLTPHLRNVKWTIRLQPMAIRETSSVNEASHRSKQNILSHVMEIMIKFSQSQREMKLMTMPQKLSITRIASQAIVMLSQNDGRRTKARTNPESSVGPETRLDYAPLEPVAMNSSQSRALLVTSANSSTI